jgi:hypothetical protein
VKELRNDDTVFLQNSIIDMKEDDSVVFLDSAAPVSAPEEAIHGFEEVTQVSDQIQKNNEKQFRLNEQETRLDDEYTASKKKLPRRIRNSCNASRSKLNN